MSTVVITPTTGIPELAQAIQSVAAQTYPVDHWVVADGMNNVEQIINIVRENAHNRLKLILLPENTGRPKYHWSKGQRQYNGHRIYGAMAYLINHDYALLLDEDNWYEPTHAETLVNTVKARDTDWGYSLRRIVDWEGKFRFNDDCDSLGIYPNRARTSFVDMNCYCFRADLFVALAPSFYDELKADKRVYQAAMATVKDPDRVCSTGVYTVNYRVPEERITQWFEPGLEEVVKQYGYNKPWSAEQ